ncbi:phosphate ABC transporter membrane protein 2, PhoT family [Nitrosococcus oceani ATCC 19707]|uniref:Phosphate transport system permease protein PstA n=2 Tax=Nitrosococcus oceani TaxID=1229 RepID=Q3JDJ5_NITOC|nr:phosphate ABC transporter permease PstA [Nitrosococcus oceani]ABA57101.1 phosphate ABC transporter membrane protein 2, PhoT family [Nitrosococcus oceani ATCC 19707]EDZ66602.1 phosphate ABC transporter, permease protein PstA [Nitrosococcus oceani AFC27]KFI20462.1 phosphate ABC transporter permease [Nitrosococcus oceani C-27]GEM19879.1 phosphate ABC transporter, permease protein PstA [Nitrosococcus oceani]
MADRLFAWLMFGCAALVVASLVWVLGDVVIEGLTHFSWSFLFAEPADAGRAGGIGPILVSTLWILLLALAVSLPLGLGVAIWLSELAPRNSRFADGTGITLDILAGVPSIVYGLFGNAFFSIYLGLGFSLLSGGLTLACMILPVFVRTCESGLRAVNDDWRRGALALGMTRSAAIWYILLPAARPAIMAGLILGIGRATAETAALLFTSGYVDRMPESLLDSGRALAVHIYDLSMNVTGGDGAAYASALVLVILIITLNTLAQSLVDKWFKRRLVVS